MRLLDSIKSAAQRLVLIYKVVSFFTSPILKLRLLFGNGITGIYMTRTLVKNSTQMNSEVFDMCFCRNLSIQLPGMNYL